MKKLTIEFWKYLLFLLAGVLMLCGGIKVCEPLKTMLFGIGTGVISSTFVAAFSDWQTNVRKDKTDADILFDHISLNFRDSFNNFKEYVSRQYSAYFQCGLELDMEAKLKNLCKNEDFALKNRQAITDKITYLLDCTVTMKKCILYTGNSFRERVLPLLEAAEKQSQDCVEYCQIEPAAQNLPGNYIIPCLKKMEEVYNSLMNFSSAAGK